MKLALKRWFLGRLRNGGRKDKVTKPCLVPVLMRSNLSSLSVHCPSFMNLRQITLAALVVLNSH